MGLRRSVLFAGESALAPVTDSALTGLTAVPYYDWWSQQATLFVPDGSTVDGWAQLRSQPALRLWGSPRTRSRRSSLLSFPFPVP